MSRIATDRTGATRRSADLAADLTRQISARDFCGFQALIHERAGIWLSDAKRALLVGRLGRRLQQLGLDDYGRYLELLRQDNSGVELEAMLNLIATNETHFYREPAHFLFLEQQVYPCWRQQAERGERPRRVRVWCAGCATGEEPYSVAMTLLRHLPAVQGWSHEVLGTDLSTRALAVARQGVWPAERARQLPEAYRRAFLLRGVGQRAGQVAANDALRAVVRLGGLNLSHPRYELSGRFDLIFLRNVLIYFRPEDKAGVIDRVASWLAPDGYFFVGHAENVTGAATPLQRVAGTVYCRSEPPRS